MFERVIDKILYEVYKWGRCWFTGL